MNFKKYSDLYLQLNEDEWKPSYLEKNRRICELRLNFFNDKNIEDIRASEIKLWLKNITDVSNKSKRNYLSVLNGILQLALEDEIINKNPIIHVKRPHYKAPKIKPFTSDEVSKILEHCKDYNFNFVYFLAMGFYTGMRTGEILSLKRIEVDFENKVLHVNSTRSRFGEGTPKTYGSKRTIPIINSLMPYIQKMYEQNNTHYVLTNQYDRPYIDSKVFHFRWWQPIFKDLNLEYRRPYNMRHTYATNMLYNDLVTPLQLAQLLGHSNTQMIYDVYVTYLDRNLDDFDRSISVYS
ncbi:MAG: site-specific integrase [Sulfurospirillaceae bacterium]|nr:site-specific integrase [Sulfurospirillaceae bacterium]